MSTNSTLFSGSIAENYHRYLAPLIFEDYARELAGRIEPQSAQNVLEIACGTGVFTRRILDRIPEDASLIATDINPAMVSAASENLNGSRSVSYRVADGTDLPFPDGSFDVVTCQFGVMFYADKALGFREAARVLNPGGEFVFNVWDSLAHNRLAELVHYKVVEMFPEDPPAFLAAPFGYHDIVDIKTALQRAGFVELELSVLPRRSHAPSARDVAMAFVFGSPLAGQLTKLGMEETAMAEVEGALLDAYGHGEITAPMQSIAITARRQQ